MMEPTATSNEDLLSTPPSNTPLDDGSSQQLPQPSTAVVETADDNEESFNVDNVASTGSSSSVPLPINNERNTAEKKGDNVPDEADENDKEFFDFNDKEIQRDAATTRVAVVVHAALVFFAGLLVVSIILAILVISKFGFLVLVLLAMLGSMFFGILAFVNKTLEDDAKLRPVRRNIRRWKALATAVVLNEVRNFQLDWNEHLLLTNEAANGDYDLYDDDDIDEDFAETVNARDNTVPPRRKKRGKSVIFKLVVKPFLGKRRLRRKKRNSQQKAKEQAPSYDPPDTPEIV